MSTAAHDLSESLRLPPGPVGLSQVATDSRHGFSGTKSEGRSALAALGEELAELQEQLHAEAYTGGRRRVLVVLQGMDTSGKGGVVNKALGHLSPIGLKVTAFGKPTEEELAHDFLWRIDRALPGPGMVGVFDRSHYEDVLVPRVHAYAESAELDRRYDAINAWEQQLVAGGTLVLKCFLHVSPEVQRERLLARLDDPLKQWKFKPGDIDERAFWDDYQQAYAVAMERCRSEAAPWHVVPADTKWYRNWAVGQLLLESMRGLDLAWPKPDYDVAEQRARLEAEA
jgi:PPK2 family polyphosphate:nucleotide phosphotransferase